jgi:hypothetical protein
MVQKMNESRWNALDRGARERISGNRGGLAMSLKRLWRGLSAQVHVLSQHVLSQVLAMSLVMLAVQPASATPIFDDGHRSPANTTFTYNFVVNGSYEVDRDPEITGSFVLFVDALHPGKDQITSIDIKTGFGEFSTILSQRPFSSPHDKDDYLIILRNSNYTFDLVLDGWSKILKGKPGKIDDDSFFLRNGCRHCGKIGSDFEGSVIDPPVTAIPEPSTWLLLLIGFAGIGFVVSRRRRTLTQHPALVG